MSLRFCPSANNPDHAMRTIPWGDWGPAATRVLFNTHRARLPKPAGPFWITGSSPFVIRDYDVLRTRYSRISGEDPSESTSRFGPPVVKSTEVFGEHWKTGKLERCVVVTAMSNNGN